MRLYMKDILSPKLILLLSVVLVCFGGALAQDNPPTDKGKPPFPGPDAKRPNLLRILGLSPEQMQQIKRMNQARKPEMDAAAVRLRMANRALDEAIYADTVDDAVFQARLKDLQLAQAEMARLRFTMELNVRKILTPDQLSRFRELRRRLGPPDQGPPPGADDKQPVPQQFRRLPN
jgi:Spy/CpxP family protein refolding chaperone